MASHSISEAAKLAGVSRRTIQRYTRSGKLSTTTNRLNNPVIDTSELIRVFENIVTPKEEDLSHPVATVTLESLQAMILELTEKVCEQNQVITNLSNRLSPPKKEGSKEEKATVSTKDLMRRLIEKNKS